MKGQRLAPQSSKKEKMRALETQLQNMQMAVRINQMMTQQMMERTKELNNELANTLGQLGELRYRVLAHEQLSNLPAEQLAALASNLRLKDFNEFSDQENAREGYTVSDTVTEDSIVVITSTTDEPKDRGIFRSKVKLADCGVPDMLKAFLGREVGAKAIVKLNEVDHTIELLAIYQPPKVIETQAEPASAPNLSVVPNEAPQA